MNRPTAWKLVWLSVLLALPLAACSQKSQTSSATPQPVEKSFTLTPGPTAVKVDFLAGELQNLTITESVDPATKKVVDRPKLRGTLKLKNASTDQSASLVKGQLEFLDAKGQVIPVSKDRGDTSFSLTTFDVKRLDPGQETSVTIDIPFPQAGLAPNDLQTVRLDLEYLPTPYREHSVTVPVSLKG